MNNTFKGTFDISTLYAVIINSDQEEGRGESIIYCYCATKEEALIISYGKDTMGSKGKIKEVKVLIDKKGSYYNKEFKEITIRYATELEKRQALNYKKKNKMIDIKRKLTIEEINFLKLNKGMI